MPGALKDVTKDGFQKCSAVLGMVNNLGMDFLIAGGLAGGTKTWITIRNCRQVNFAEHGA